MTASSKVRTAHQARFAYVYVRQSSLQQVNQNRESPDLQYRLVERAHYLGWPQERIQVIDEDLGKSGASIAERQGHAECQNTLHCAKSEKNIANRVGINMLRNLHLQFLA